MEIHIVAQMKCIERAVFGNLPGAGNAGLHSERIIELNKPVEKLVYTPDIGLIACKGRIKRPDA
ncbi:hypothetical protein SDC9_105725 [bioreactor metagenome]|uniref:Uncharacterized protein n=1 Tax=bioreactor metagenome TaxID=1076179 RepID=A0A645B0B3_9ZZZZ